MGGIMRTIQLLSKCSAIITVAVLLSFVQLQAITITPKVRVNRPVINADTTEIVYLLVQFDSPEIFIDKNLHKPDFNLGLVIDRSGSMNDKGKMTYAKKAAQYAVDQMLPSDRLEVVEHDEHISVLWPSTPVEPPKLIQSRIAELSL